MSQDEWPRSSSSTACSPARRSSSSAALVLRGEAGKAYPKPGISSRRQLSTLDLAEGRPVS